MRWIVDTSAWARRDDPAVAAELERILRDDGELVLSPAVLLELLRGPQGGAVATEREELTGSMQVLEPTAETFELAAEAMVRLAEHSPDGHRRPIADLVTSALAHEHQVGVVHRDDDFTAIADHSGLEFEHRRIEPAGTGAGADSPATRQRELRKELAQLLHQLPVAQAESVLEEAVDAVRARISAG